MTDQDTIGCDEALRLLAEYLAHELDDGAAGDVATHLERCRSCYSRAEFERRLKSQLGTVGTEPVPSTLERRIRLLLG